MNAPVEADPLRPVFAAVSAAGGPLAKFKALTREAEKLAIPLRHGLSGFDYADIEQRLIHLAESHELVEALTREAVEVGIVSALNSPPFSDSDTPPDDNWQPPGEIPEQATNSAPQKNALTVFPLVAFKDIRLDLTQRNYRVKGLLPRSGLAVIWGPPKCYKSFWAMDVAFHIAVGWLYRDRRVEQAPIIYIGLEGRSGLPARKEALARHYRVEEAPFYLVTTPLDLAKQADALIASIKAQLGDVKPGAVFIDTLNRSLVGSESKDEDMAAYLAGASKIEQHFGCLVAIVHHCGVDASRPRGHTSLTGAVEVQLKVQRVADLHVLVTVEWAKDFPEGAEITSRLESVELGKDADDDPVTSLVVLPAEPVLSKDGERLTPNQATMFRILHAAGPRGLSLEDWNEQSRREGIGGKRKATLSDVRAALHAKGLITEMMHGWAVKQPSKG